MKTKNIFKALTFAMMMPAMLLTTACSSSDDDIAANNNENTDKKGFTLPVTVNVTREGDATTRVTYNESTKKLAFSEGDKLFVWGTHSTAGQFAGTLEWESEGKFSGTITTRNEYTGTVEALLAAGTHAELLPDDYNTYKYLSITHNYGYNDKVHHDNSNAITLLKVDAIKQFSREEATSYSSSLALSPKNTILNFTIDGLPKSTEVTATLSVTTYGIVSGKVSTDNNGFATFAMAIPGGKYFINELNLTMNGAPITLSSSSTELDAGHIYNISRNADPTSDFSVSVSKRVFFAPGNLQATYDGTSWTWAFAANQWDYIGNAAANTSINGNGTIDGTGTVDLFGWSTSENYFGIFNSENYIHYTGDFKDWGDNIGSGWRTLTSEEWKYVFTERGTSTGIRYAKAKVNGVNGVILLPDNWSTSYYTLDSTNSANADYTTNKISSSDWTTSLEAKGAVFLPAAGWRRNNYIFYNLDGSNLGISGYYWSSTLYAGSTFSYRVLFDSDELILQGDEEGVEKPYVERYNGFSVRLVYDIQ